MTKWEYAVDAMAVSDMAARGQDGWELVAVHDGMAFFKRESAPAPAPATPAQMPAPAPAPAPDPVVAEPAAA